jgi:hypothetical protein
MVMICIYRGTSGDAVGINQTKPGQTKPRSLAGEWRDNAADMTDIEKISESSL